MLWLSPVLLYKAALYQKTEFSLEHTQKTASICQAPRQEGSAQGEARLSFCVLPDGPASSQGASSELSRHHVRHLTLQEWKE